MGIPKHINDLLRLGAPELIEKAIYVLSGEYEQVQSLNVDYMFRGGQPLDTHKAVLFRNLQIIRDCFEVVSKSKNIDTATSRVQLLHQKIYDIEPYYVLFGGADVSEISTTLDKMIVDAHTSFYINYYYANIAKSEGSKRKATIEKYRDMAINSLQQGMLDDYTDKSDIQQLLAKYETSNIIGGDDLVLNILVDKDIRNDEVLIVEPQPRTIQINTELYEQIGMDKVLHLATLDFRCCLVCACLDGTVRSIKCVQKCIHEGCRCAQLPTRDGDLMGMRPFVKSRCSVKDIPKDSRDGLIGQVPANTTFKQWFLTLSEQHQNEYLGDFRFNLFKNHEFSLADFVDFKEHRELTNMELNEKLKQINKSNDIMLEQPQLKINQENSGLISRFLKLLKG